MTFIDNYSELLRDLDAGRITHTEFLKHSGFLKQYQNWCKEHCISPCEDNAELFFDMHGFAESEDVKEFIESA